MASFSVRARAVDLLGRQQIAGIPTALHELFKNAHDAYARRVEVDYFRSPRQLVLRDDGDGMAPDEFVSKWLTLGTESKVGANSKEGPKNAPRGLKPRPMLGEKGIGRLAVAALGPVVLIMTRRDPAFKDDDRLTAALVHWGLFEVPGIDLNEVGIPTRNFPGGSLPSQADIESLVEELELAILRLALPEPDRVQSLLNALQSMRTIDPAQLNAWLQSDADRDNREGLSLAGLGHGTHFIIAPVDSILDADIDVKGHWGSSPFQRLLLGFGNTLSGDDADFVAEFRDHQNDGRTFELIGRQSFFTPDEFTSLDHHFEGDFDEYGQFTGTIQLYRGEPQPYVLSYPNAGGRQIECGPFKLRLGYLMGESNESQLPRDDHSIMYDKMNRLGGLYIYRDGIRVLPYGNSDYDFLNIEQRRTLAAKDWFFSYRRMIGWIDLSFSQNAHLVEKAGREGFRENKAFRQFKEILETFFKQVAVDYFRVTSDLGADFRNERARLDADAARLKKRDDSTRERKRRFALDLQKALERVENGKPARDLEVLLVSLEERISALEKSPVPPTSDELLFIESDTLRQLQDVEQSIDLVRPRGVALTKSVNSAWLSFGAARDTVKESVLDPGRQVILSRIEALREGLGIGLERHKRAIGALQRERSASYNELKRLRKQVGDAVRIVQGAIDSTLKGEMSEFQRTSELVIADLSRVNLDELDQNEAFERQLVAERLLEQNTASGRSLLTSIRDQLNNLAEDVSAREDSGETTAAIERRLIEVQDRLTMYTDLAQAGSAVGIIGHEFGNVADGIRKSVDRLKPWAAGTPALRELHKDLVTYFSELEGYLSLFAPLSRRRYRRKMTVSGSYVEKYLIESLAGRLDETESSLIVTEPFRTKSLEGLLPTLLAASLNIVDNAIYWASTNDSPRMIYLDADSEGWTFSNSGPGIPLRMANRIFEFGVSTKPGGRGLGLAVSRDALRSQGCELELLNPGVHGSPIFRIRMAKTEATGEVGDA